MKISADRLAGHLNDNLTSVYLIAGDEPLLVDEAGAAIRRRAREAGFEERERHVAERGFDWDALEASGASMSLFASRRIVEVHLPTGKPGLKGGKALAAYASAVDDDTCLLVFAPKLDRKSQGAAWVKALDKAGVFVQVWPVDAGRLPAWIAGRMRGRGLNPVGDAVAVLVERVEGNLLAANQEIEKLLLLRGEGDVDGETVAQSVADSARFDVYALADAALLGDTARAVRVLDGLRAEGVQPPLILWALSRDIRTLCSVLCAIEAGQSLDAGLRQAHVWSNRKAIVSRAARRLRAASRAQSLLLASAHCERIAKGMAQGDEWQALLGVVARLAGGASNLRRAG